MLRQYDSLRSIIYSHARTQSHRESITSNGTPFEPSHFSFNQCLFHHFLLSIGPCPLTASSSSPNSSSNLIYITKWPAVNASRDRITLMVMLCFWIWNGSNLKRKTSIGTNFTRAKPGKYIHHVANNETVDASNSWCTEIIQYWFLAWIKLYRLHDCCGWNFPTTPNYAFHLNIFKTPKWNSNIVM